MNDLARTLLGGAGLLLVLVTVYWTLLYLTQRSVMFPGPVAMPPDSPPADLERVWLEIDGGRVESWFLPALESAADSGPVLIFAHGNAESIDLWPREFVRLRRRGVSALLVEYPGYGRSTGQASETSVTATMVAAWEYLTGEKGIDESRILGYGRSIGSGAVCALARERPVAGLILESGFTSTAALARGYGLPSFLIRDPFDNVAALEGFTGPVLLLHGERDRIIPPIHSRRLLRAAPEAELELLDCGHNDCPRPWERILDFLTTHGWLG